MNFDKKALVGFITEIEASRDRAKGETRHQSEIFKKAREKGFEPKAMRQVLQRRAMKAGDRERMDELLDLYEHAMGALAEAVDAVQSGMSAREASERFGVPRGSLGAVVGGTKNAISEPPHDADGVVTETQEKADDQNNGDSGRAPAVRVGVAVAAVGGDARAFGMAAGGCPAASAYDPDADGRSWPERTSQPTGTSGATIAVGAVGPSSGRVAPNNPDEDDLAIPPFLIRAKQERAA